MSQDNLPDIYELSDIDHPHFAINLLNSMKESLDREKHIQQNYEDEAKLCRAQGAERAADRNCVTSKKDEDIQIKGQTMWHYHKVA
jgi:hypothetical protein